MPMSRELVASRREIELNIPLDKARHTLLYRVQRERTGAESSVTIYTEATILMIGSSWMRSPCNLCLIFPQICLCWRSAKTQNSVYISFINTRHQRIHSCIWCDLEWDHGAKTKPYGYKEVPVFSHRRPGGEDKEKLVGEEVECTGFFRSGRYAYVASP